MESESIPPDVASSRLLLQVAALRLKKVLSKAIPTTALRARGVRQMAMPWFALSLFVQPLDLPIAAGAGLVLVLLVLSGIISGSEIAFFSLGPKQLRELAESEDETDGIVLQLLERPRLLLSTILVANNFVNIAITIIMFYLVRSVVDFKQFGNEALWELIITAAIVTPILVLFGENTPKVYANQNNLGLARFTARFLRFLRSLFYPIGILLVKAGMFFENRFERKAADIDYSEIEKAIEISADKDATVHDMAILKGIIHLGDTAARQIMQPRLEMEALDNAWAFPQVLAKIRETGFSRFPVYHETIDNIEGVLYAKDLLYHLDKDEDFAWQELMREASFVPETKKIDDLLREIQASRKHLVIVVDEYGGTQGLVTLEDILEEVVGDIQDEFDDESLDLPFRKLDKNNYILEAKTTLHDVCKYLDIDSSTFEAVQGEADSLGGLVLELTGRIPQKGDRVSFENYEFVVLDMEVNRLLTIKLTIHPKMDSE